jgi:hypothetical protein
MFKTIFTWFIDLFPKSKPATEGLLEAFAEANQDVEDFIKDIQDAINAEQKQFLVQVTVGPDTKMRPLKAGMEATLMEAMAKSNPECTDWTVKSYYHRSNA